MSVKGDPLMRDAYAFMMDGGNNGAPQLTPQLTKTVIGDSSDETLTYTIKENPNPSQNGLPIQISVHLPDDKKEVLNEMANEHTCPSCDANAKQNGKQADTVTKGENLASTLNTLMEDVEDKDADDCGNV